MKSLIRLAVMSCAVLVLALPAGADGLRGKIPFSFTVMDREMPAGDYTVTVDPFTHRVLLDNGLDHRSYVLFMTNRQLTEDGKNLTMTFHKYGDRYFLRRVSGATNVVDVVPSVEEKWAKRASNESRGGARMALVSVALR